MLSILSRSSIVEDNLINSSVRFNISINNQFYYLVGLRRISKKE
jgi:hypothetical protein